MAQCPPPGLTPNPYGQLLYAALADHGLPTAPLPDFDFRSLWRFRRTVRFLHFHWQPERCYAPCLVGLKSVGRLRRARAAIQLGRFGARLTWASLLGYRLVWTVHEVPPSRSPPMAARIDRAGRWLLAAASSLVMAHSEAVAEQLRVEIAIPSLDIEIVPHGTFAGMYGPLRHADAVRDALGIPRNAFVFLVFGQIRPDKQVGLLLDAFAKADLSNACLLVAGPAYRPGLEARLVRAAREDTRIKLMLETVEVGRVSELFAAADAFVLARSVVWTSGSLVLALSLGVPAVAADLPSTEELLGQEDAGWLFTPGKAGSLADALKRAARDPLGAAEKRAGARVRGSQLPTWDEVGRRTAQLLAAIAPG